MWDKRTNLFVETLRALINRNLLYPCNLLCNLRVNQFSVWMKTCFAIQDRLPRRSGRNPPGVPRFLKNKSSIMPGHFTVSFEFDGSPQP